jgi:hypothetical protein
VKKGASVMKKLLLIIAITLFGANAVAAAPAQYAAVYGQKRDDKKKEPVGPPVVRDKKDEKPKNPPKRDKKPD